MVLEEYAARIDASRASGEGECLREDLECRFVLLPYFEFRSSSRSGVKDTDERLLRSAWRDDSAGGSSRDL
jgi:hypothetical protein